MENVGLCRKRMFMLGILSCFLSLLAVEVGISATTNDGAVAGLKPKLGDVNGIRTRYYEMGQGEPMLLIHGGGWAGSSNTNNFSTVIPLLSKKYHVYAPDRLGHGLTDNPKSDKDYNQQGEVDFLYQFIQVHEDEPDSSGRTLVGRCDCVLSRYRASRSREGPRPDRARSAEPVGK